MPRGTVAENIKVRRSEGVASKIDSNSSRNPMFNISSASSNTTARRPDVSKDPRSMWSRKRPGVPTTMCTPRFKARRSVPMSMPPTQEEILAPVGSKSHSSSRFTCKASSRVGAITSAKGTVARSNVSAPSSRVGASAKPNATVLPEPVWAETKRSESANFGSETETCTGVKAV